MSAMMTVGEIYWSSSGVIGFPLREVWSASPVPGPKTASTRWHPGFGGVVSAVLSTPLFSAIGAGSLGAQGFFLLAGWVRTCRGNGGIGSGALGGHKCGQQ